MVIGEIPITPTEKVEDAVAAAEEAFKVWSNTSIGKRMEYLFKLHAQKIVADRAKHIADARAEVGRAIQLTETSCAILSLRPVKLQNNWLQMVCS